MEWFSELEWWGWVLIVLAVAIIIPLKLKVWKILFFNNKKDPPEDDY